MGRAMTWLTQRMESWGRLCPVDMQVECPGTQDEVEAAMRNAPGKGLVAFGAGRSYGDQPLVSVGSAILTRELDRLGAFDPHTGELVAEAGVTLREIVRQFLPRGYMPPVCPGTGFVTLGGCVANDIHGKNHESKGGFGQHVQWFDLLLPSGEVRRVSPDDAELFSATLGGMGLTGVILRVCLRLQAVCSNAVDLQEERVPNLEAFIDRFEAVRTKASYSVGWIDGMAVGRHLGRGVLETAEPSETDVVTTTPTRLSLRWTLPSFALSPLSVKAFNALYYRRIPALGRRRKVGLERFLFPLDAIANWNRLYGRRGFFQFQCVLPDQEAFAGLGRLLRAVSAWRASSFLAVLKTLGGASQGMLSFPMRGYTLAMDLPNRDGVRDLLANLEAITLEHRGRVYLAKDAALSPSGFRRMYPRLDEYRQVLERIDPQSRMLSDMARRLRIREADAGQDHSLNTAATCPETRATTSCRT
jgi:decaprenylphospho-beta-D-ribofuranose 2-oxidase